ncbi:MAG: bifunctional DNA primase/polymerase [Desulfobacterales bacterium]
MDMLSHALQYSDRFSIIPIRKDNKKSLVKWTDFQKRRATPEEIREWWQKWPDAMIGIVTGSISGVFVIDCDTEEGYQAIQKYIPDSLLTPLARTPRGGWHLYFIFSNGMKLATRAKVIPGVDVRGEGGYIIAPPSVNGTGKTYAWVEGLSIENIPPVQAPEALYNIISIYKHKEEGGPTSNPLHFFSKGRRDDDLFHAAHCMIKGGCEVPFASHVLNILAKNATPPFPEKEADAKIQSALKRSESKERNLAAEVREWVLSTSGNFLSTDVYNCLHLSTRDEKKNVSIILKRLCDEGQIEKYGNKNGCFRRIDREIEFMDFANADIDNYIDVCLPLDLHKKTSIYPKGVIVIAGVSGMGKTLFSFNTIVENMGRFPIFYFNAEMGPEALKKKLSHFPIPISKWEKHMKVVDNWDFNNISDKIQPDAFNVVDYLEPDGEKAFNIHGVISAIIRRLDQGMALITIQKKPDAKMGTGGIYSLKAATLALALDWGRLEVVKNRFREADPRPMLTKVNFEVHQGYRFVQMGDWYK